MQSDLLVWEVLYRGMGEVGLIKALLSPDVVLYQMYIMKRWGDSALRCRVFMRRSIL